MSHYITCDLKGGLGNQLFQIFTTIAFARSQNCGFIFTDAAMLGERTTTPRKTYWGDFLQELRPATRPIAQCSAVITEAGFHYTPIPGVPYRRNAITMLRGYFQSWRYFAQHFGIIYRLLQIERKKGELGVGADISLHFRLGDYKLAPDYHPVLPLAYYERALRRVYRGGSAATVLWFCEEADLDEVVREYIEPLACTWPQLSFVRGGVGLADWQQMLLMSKCRCNVIANSSFSWWAAHLNTCADKAVVSPAQWFGAKLAGHDLRDLRPPEWIVC